MRFDFVGNCVNCGVRLFSGNQWLADYGTGHLYHEGTSSLFCDYNDEMFSFKDATRKATLPTKVKISPSEIPSLVDPEPFCTLVVTFIDGTVVEYPNIRFQDKLSEPDPIKINGTTVVVENKDQTITLLGVRSFKMEFPDAE